MKHNEGSQRIDTDQMNQRGLSEGERYKHRAPSDTSETYEQNTGECERTVNTTAPGRREGRQTDLTKTTLSSCYKCHTNE